MCLPSSPYAQPVPLLPELCPVPSSLSSSPSPQLNPVLSHLTWPAPSLSIPFSTVHKCVWDILEAQRSPLSHPPPWLLLPSHIHAFSGQAHLHPRSPHPSTARCLLNQSPAWIGPQPRPSLRPRTPLTFPAGLSAFSPTRSSSPVLLLDLPVRHRTLAPVPSKPSPHP